MNRFFNLKILTVFNGIGSKVESGIGTTHKANKIFLHVLIIIHNAGPIPQPPLRNKYYKCVYRLNYGTLK